MLDMFDSKMQFDHERLDVCGAAVELDGVVVTMARAAPSETRVPATPEILIIVSMDFDGRMRSSNEREVRLG